MDIIQQVEQKHMKDTLPQFNVGDTVEVHVRLKEGDKERIQAFIGTVIGRKGTGTRETFTVRRLVQGEGVERTFPIHSPAIADVKVRRRGKVRRAKLYYLRDKVGKSTKVKELIVASEGGKKRRRKRGRKGTKAAAAAQPASVPAAEPETEAPAETEGEE